MIDNNVYKVGSVYDNLKTNENNIFFVWDNHIGMRLLYRVSSPTDSDMVFFKKGRPFELRYLLQGNVCFFAFRFGGMLMWYDNVFSPSTALYAHGHNPIFPKKIEEGMGLPITITGINSSTGEVFGQREIGLPTEFSRSWLLWANSTNNNISIDQYNEIVNSIYDNYDTYTGAWIANEAMAREQALAERVRNMKTRRKVKKVANHFVFSTESSEVIA